MAQEWWASSPVVSEQPQRGQDIYIPPAGPTPEEQASAARAQRGLELQEQAAARAAQGEERAQAEFEGTGGKPTEAQAKASVLLTRIKGGFADIQGVLERNKSAQEAGLAETMAQNVFGEGLITRSIAGPDRRIVRDAQRDILDGLLTLGTGAAYNKEQLEGQTVSYFPQYGDTEEEIKAKNQRMLRLIEAAKVNSGPKWAEVESAIAPFMPKADGTPAGLQVAEGETYSTDEDLDQARKLTEAWRGGATIEQIQSMMRPGESLTPADIERLQADKDRVLPFGPASSGRREAGGPGTAAALGAGMLKGYTGNMAEEIAGLVSPDAAAKLQAAGSFAQETAPVTSFLGELAGGIVSPLARLPLGRAGTVAGEGMRGAAYGGIYGAGEAAPGMGIEDRLTGAAIGAATGGAGGALAGRLMGRGAQVADEVAPPASTAPDANISPAVPPAPETAAASDMEAIVDLARKATGNSIGARSAKRELADLAKVNPAAQEAAERLGISLPPDVLSDNTQLLSLTGLSRSQVGSEAETAWHRTAREAIDRSEQVMAELGAQKGLAEVSEGVGQRINATMTALENQASALRREVDGAINIQERVEASNLQGALGKVIEDLGGIDEAKLAMSGEERKLLAMLGEGEVAKAPTYARLNMIRDQIGDALNKGRGPWVDTAQSSLRKYYGALAEDQIQHIERVAGKEIADKQRAANSLFRDMYEKRDEMQALFGRDLDKGIAPLIRRAIGGGKTGDASALNKALANIPEDMHGNVLMSGILAESMGKGGMGGFSFNNFAKTYRGLRENPSIYKRVANAIGPKGDQTLIDLYAISRRMIEAENKVLKTGKANQALISQLNAESLLARTVKGAVSGAASKVVGRGIVGAVEELAQRGAGGPRSDRLHRVLASDEFRGLMEKTAMGAPTDGAVNRLAGSKAFVEYAKRLPGVKDFTSRAAWIKAAFAQTGANASPQVTPVTPTENIQ